MYKKIYNETWYLVVGKLIEKNKDKEFESGPCLGGLNCSQNIYVIK